MSKCTYNLEVLDYFEIEEIQKNVAFRSKGLQNKIIRDNIFEILEREAEVIYYPADDEEICAFYKKVDKKKFVFINTSLLYEKQIFAAAHELAHIWRVACDNQELLKASTVNDYTTGENDFKEKEKIEFIANRFAAEFLVQEDVLIKELDVCKCKKNEINLSDIVKLMDRFLVPYKTIVRRLYETGYIDKVKCEKFLNETDKVLLMQKRLQLCERNNERTKRIKLGNFVDLALRSYENGLRTYEKLNQLLGMINETPAEYGIDKEDVNLMTEEELEKMLGEE